jgi:hypothetical protein
MKLLPEYLPKKLLERLVLGCDELPEGFVDESLVVPSSSIIDPSSEPIQQIIVQTNGDPGLPRRGGRDCTSASGTEVVFLSHRHSP